jgi:hypothetical protein
MAQPGLRFGRHHDLDSINHPIMASPPAPAPAQVPLVIKTATSVLSHLLHPLPHHLQKQLLQLLQQQQQRPQQKVLQPPQHWGSRLAAAEDGVAEENSRREVRWPEAWKPSACLCAQGKPKVAVDSTYCESKLVNNYKSGSCWLTSRVQFTMGGQLGKCPNMCPICTRKPAIHCPFIRLVPFLL